MKKNKYGNRKIHAKEGVFDSKKEYLRYLELVQKEKNGEIWSLARQVKYALTEKYTDVHTKKTVRGMDYICDFTYYECGHKHTKFIVEDVKGAKTPLYMAKKKMMYHIYKICILET